MEACRYKAYYRWEGTEGVRYEVGYRDSPHQKTPNSNDRMERMEMEKQQKQTDNAVDVFS